ncbi:hypothetical protein [Streptomyces acidiscabies]|uniref:hypothetical protein n=1 Tax=Streptomyces acidiscabies TaxID=42234 RepID=UPI000A7AB4C4|nr:hypothetical protein [Streptomyces acidiscabies]
MDLSAEVYACCEIPWAATTVEENYFAVEVNTHFGDAWVSAMAVMVTMATGDGFGEGLNSRAYEGTVGLFEEEMPDWMPKVGFCDTNAQPPKTSISLKFMLPDWSGLYAADGNGQPVKNPRAFEDLYECILFAINQAIYSIVEDESVRVGPLCHGDLIGDGIIRINPTISNEPFYVKLPATTPLGAFNSGKVGYSPDLNGDMEMPQYPLSSAEPVRRLFSWMRRSVLRAQRKEWAEAIVAQQASLEDWMHYLMCGIAADHGFTSSEFSEAGFEEKNAAETFGILASHLGGNSEMASRAQKRVWKNRNAVVHRGERGTESLYEEAYTAAMVVQNWTRDRLITPDVARRHPITSWIIHHDDTPLPDRARTAIAELLRPGSLASLPAVNDGRSLAEFPVRNISRPSDCWGKGVKVPRPF